MTSIEIILELELSVCILAEYVYYTRQQKKRGDSRIVLARSFLVKLAQSMLRRISEVEERGGNIGNLIFA